MFKVINIALLALSIAFLLVVSASNASAQTTSTATPAPFAPIITSTPQADGSIVHVVASDETLWQIALSYGVKVADILEMNGLQANTNAIYVGEKLIIRLPVTATATLPVSPSATATRQPSRTPRPPTPTRTPTMAATSTPSFTPTNAPLIQLPNMPDQKTLAFVLIGIGVVGLFAILLTGFRK